VEEIFQPFTGDTESYNGTTWTELNNLNTARSSFVVVQELTQLL
jgi:hypothetical protein